MLAIVAGLTCLILVISLWPKISASFYQLRRPTALNDALHHALFGAFSTESLEYLTTFSATTTPLSKFPLETLGPNPAYILTYPNQSRWVCVPSNWETGAAGWAQVRRQLEALNMWTTSTCVVDEEHSTVYVKLRELEQH